MKLSIKSDNKNYLARVVELKNIRKHSNADKLQCVAIQGNNVITGLNAKENDIYIYFPLECAINKEYLSWSNSFESKELNADVNAKGFFGKHGRVKAISLRGEKSEGYIVPISNILNWLVSKGNKINPSDIGNIFPVDVDFDTIAGDDNKDILLCEKYINPVLLQKANQENKKKDKKVKRESKIIPNQFRVSEDTEQLKRNMHKLELHDVITISYKMHGTNMSMGKVLCKRKLNWSEKILKKFGIKIDENHYDLVYASRRVVKNEFADKKVDSFYDMDVWQIMAEKYKDAIKDGVVLYGEVVNQLPNGKWIQKEYDYGLEPKKADFYTYRGTIVNSNGEVFEMTTPQLERYCKKMGIPMVPIFYYGTVRNYILELNRGYHGGGEDSGKNIDFEDRDWRDNLLRIWMDQYNEKNCYLCKNKVPEEGVVIIKESDSFEAFKLKSFKFLKRESDELDSGEVNIEDEESAV